MTATLAEPASRARREIAISTVIIRLGLAIVGAALVFSAFGLWLVPGAAAMPGLSLMKLGISLFMLIFGMCCLVGARGPGR